MLRSAEHLFLPISSTVEYYINYSNVTTSHDACGDLVFTVIRHFSGFRLHHRVYETEDFCKQLKLSSEETLMWVLKYGHTLPKNISDLKNEVLSQ